jgi:TP901 family phage tail tape measure protein
MGKMGSSLKTMGVAAVAAGTAVGAGLALETYKSVTAFQDFEKAVSNAASVTGLTGEAFDAAKKNISAVAQELGQKTSFSSSQAADALYSLASAGVDVANMASSQLVPVLNLAAGTQYGLAETTDVVTSTLSSFGMGFDSAGRVADVFASAAGKTQANMEKLGYSMVNVGTVAKNLNIPLEDTTAALGVLYNSGMDGSTAGTALKGIMASLAAPTKAAATSLEMYGLKVEDVNPATHKFSDIVQTLADHGLNAAGAVDIFGREGMAAIMSLTSHSSDLKTLTSDLGNVGGAAQTMADQQLDTLDGSLQALSGSLENLMINVGQALAPTIRQIADGFNSMIPSIQNWVVAFVTGFTEFISGLGSSWVSIQVIAESIGAIFGTLFSGVVGDLGAGSLSDKINAVMEGIAGVIYEAVPKIQNGITSIINFFNQLVSGLAPTWTNLQTIASNVLSTFQAFFSGISASASGDVAGGISGTINAITGVLSGLSTVVSSALVAVAPTVRIIFSTIIGIISDFVNNLGPTWDNLGLIFDSAGRIISSAVQAISPAFSSLSESLSGIGVNSSIGQKIANIFNSITTAIADFTMSVAENGISGAIEQAFNIDLPEIDLGSIWDSLTSAFNTGKKIISGFAKDLKPTWDNLTSSFDSIKDIIKDVAPSFSTFFDTLGGSGASSTSSALSVLAGVINVVSGAIAGLLKWLADNPAVVKFGLAIAGIAAAFVTLAPAISAVIGVIGTVAGAFGTIATAASGLIAMIGAEGLGATLGYLFATAFPGLASAITAVASVALPILSTAFGILVNTVIPILIEGLGLLLTPIGLIGVAVAALALAWTQNWFGIRDRAYEVWEMIKTGISDLYNELLVKYDLIKAQITFLYNEWVNRWDKFWNYLTTVKKLISQKIDEIKADIKLKWDQIKTTITTAIDNIKKAIETKVTDFKNAGIKLMQGLIDGVKSKIDAAKKSVSDFLNDPFGNSKSSAESNAKNTGSSVGKSAVTGINSQKGSAQSAGSGLGSSAVSAVGSFISSAYSSGRSIGQSVANGLNSARSYVASAASSIASTISSYLPHSPAEKGPLSKLPNFKAYINEPFEDAVSDVEPMVQRGVSVFGSLASNLTPSTVARAQTTNNNSVSNGDIIFEFNIENVGSQADIDSLVTQIERRIISNARQRGAI